MINCALLLVYVVIYKIYYTIKSMFNFNQNFMSRKILILIFTIIVILCLEYMYMDLR